QKWKALAETLPSYQDSDGLLKYFPNMNDGTDTLTSYVLSVTKEAGLALPGPVEGAMVTALQKFVDGSLKRPPSLFADLTLRKLSALEALSGVGKADPKALGSITIEPNLWPTSSVIDFWSILARTPTIQNRDRLTADTEQILRSRLHAEGTTLNFSSKT